jgi:uncharacterized protein YecE (DUF72 family)
MKTAGDVRIGISGWNYPPWRGVFYPEKLRQKDELAYAANIFHSIEVNGTFYSLQRPTTFQSWYDQTPAEFVFAIKGSRFITHLRRLRDVETPLANFFASGILALEEKLGPILWQLPPNFRFDAQVIDNFLKLLPTTTEQAIDLAERHDRWMSSRRLVRAIHHSPLRHALEVRHQSFAVPELIDLLRAYNVSLVCADAVEWPLLMDVTADFVYCRLHGSKVLYISGYDEEAIQSWGKRVAEWATGKNPGDHHASPKPAPQLERRDVYVYFDNDTKVRAPVDAQSLEKTVYRLLGIQKEENQPLKATQQF